MITPTPPEADYSCRQPSSRILKAGQSAATTPLLGVLRQIVEIPFPYFFPLYSTLPRRPPVDTIESITHTNIGTHTISRSRNAVSQEPSIGRGRVISRNQYPKEACWSLVMVLRLSRSISACSDISRKAFIARRTFGAAERVGIDMSTESLMVCRGRAEAVQERLSGVLERYRNSSFFQMLINRGSGGFVFCITPPSFWYCGSVSHHDFSISDQFASWEGFGERIGYHSLSGD